MAALDLRRRQWAAVTAVAGYATAAAAALGVLAATGADPVAVAVLAVAAVAVLVVVLARLLGRTSAIARRLAAETRVVVDVNPSLRLDPVGAGELYLLAAAVNRLADRRESAEKEVAQRVEEGRREMEAERNRLAALMAELTAAVVVCNPEGRILLYNDAARDLVDDDALLGLGRSVFAVVDRGLIAHAHERLAVGEEAVHAATTLRGGRLLGVRVGLVRDTARGAPAGFVLVLEDLTRQVRAADRREAQLRRLTEATRAALGSIRAAVETVLDFPNLTEPERARFLRIVREEAERLGERVDAWAQEAGRPEEDQVLTDIRGADLLSLAAGELQQAGVAADVLPVPEDVWVRADGYAVSRAVAHLASRLRERHSVGDVALSLSQADRHVQLDARWTGAAPPSSELEAWLAEPLAGPGTPTARDVVDRHRGEVWASPDAGATAYLRLLLPAAPGTPQEARPAVTPAPRAPSRPEFYDFDLFTAGAAAGDWETRRLEEVAFTVLDTETTGLDPDGGDRVVSLGAVRVVNGRVLRSETFERLVDPGRPVPASASAIHGITDEMVAGEPSLAEVLPSLAAFAADTVLAGHDVGFDLRFLRQAGAAGLPGADQPVLDTLLLDAALHPDHDDHTLEAIASRLGVSVVGRHTALGDALVTGEVLVALLALLRRRGVSTLGEALALSRETYEARAAQRRYER